MKKYIINGGYINWINICEWIKTNRKYKQKRIRIGAYVYRKPNWTQVLTYLIFKLSTYMTSASYIHITSFEENCYKNIKSHYKIPNIIMTMICLYLFSHSTVCFSLFLMTEVEWLRILEVNQHINYKLYWR